MKATKRAKLAAKVLEDTYGWTITENAHRRCTCGETASEGDRFCSDCGKKLPKETVDLQALEQLEHAIQIALGRS